MITDLGCVLGNVYNGSTWFRGKAWIARHCHTLCLHARFPTGINVPTIGHTAFCHEISEIPVS